MLNYIAYLNARHLEKNKKWKPSFEAYKKIAKDPKNTPAKLAYRIGFVAEKAQDWKSAEAWLTKAVKGQPDKAQWLYRLALAQEKNKKYAAAIGSYNKALKINPEKADWIYRSGLCHEILKKYPAAQACYEAALEKQPASAEWQYRLGKVLWLSGQSASAEAPLRKAMELEPENALYAHELSVVIRKQGRTWQEVEALAHTLALDAGKAQWQFEQGEAQDKMNRFSEAGAAFREANRLKPGNAIWHYREGYAWERADERKLADSAYTAARACDKDLKAKIFGIGVFHQHRGLWPQAAAAYENEARVQPFNGELLYRLGLAHDRCYRWEKAADCYKQALVFEPHKPDWHYRLGFVLERQGLLQQAAQAYEYAATTRSIHTPYWFYRLGYVLAGAGEYEKACAAFLHTRTEADLAAQPVAQAKLSEAQTVLSEEYMHGLKANLRTLQMGGMALNSKDQATTFYKLGNQAERLQMWEEAAEAYQAAVERVPKHNGHWYYRLGYVLTKMERMHAAASAFSETRVFKQAHGVDMTRYEKDAGLIQVMEYTEYLETLSVRTNVILYESYSGVSISCNPYAIYQAIVDSSRFSDWIHVWVLNDVDRIPADCIGRKNVIFVPRDSQLYQRYLATAGWLINNSTFPTYFIRREDQYYLNTWHGTPFKTLGRDIKGNFMEHKNSARNFLQATHIISPNEHTTKILLERNGVAGLFSGKIAETGYPRNDLVINATADEKFEFRKKLGVVDDGKPLVLYAPTWRGILGHPEINPEKLISDLKNLQEQECHVIFRGHYFAEKALAEVGLGNVYIAPQAMDTSELLAIVDILVTDYSSIFFDFLPTGRPIVFYAYDLEQYQQERGLYFDMDKMPGLICNDIDELNIELCQIIFELSTGMWKCNDNYYRAKNKFCAFEDGYSSGRAVEFLFESNNSCVVLNKDDRKRVLINIGDIGINGITTAGLNFVKNISENYNVTLIVDVGSEKSGGRKHQVISGVSEKVHVLAKAGRRIISAEGKWVNEKYFQQNSVSKPQFDLLKSAEKKEFKRMFGSGYVDYVINFDGYPRAWALLFALGVPDGSCNAIWLHNNMREEQKLKYPFLEAVFGLYKNYQKIISVSESVYAANFFELKEYIPDSEEKMIFIENFVDVDSIILNSLESLDKDIEEWLAEWKGFLYVNVGRLSVEKNHRRLVEAFSRISNIADSRLAIMGSGMLLPEIEIEIEKLGLKDNVRVFEARSNPFPLMKKANCFVLSSDHEGQGLVLFEAMALNVPVISTDIPGPRSVLANGVGVLVEATSDALSKAMDSAYDCSSSIQKFDFEEYNGMISEKISYNFN